MPRTAGALGWRCHVGLFTSRKVMVDFVSLTLRLVIKMPNPIGSSPDEPPFLPVQK